MKIAPHRYSGERVAGEIVLEWVDDDTLIVQVTAEDVRPARNEGISTHLDNSFGSLSVAGAVSIMAAVALTENEARELHRELGELLEPAPAEDGGSHRKETEQSAP